MLEWFTADLHIHTCLSPCGELSMSPRKIVAEALRRQIDIIGITDHNASANVAAVMKAAGGTRLVVVPGMEVCTAEEVHVVVLFESPEPLDALQTMVSAHLQGMNDPELFGIQVVANEHDEVEGFEEKLLIGAVDLPLDRLVREVHRLGGLAIAAHIDRESYSVIGQLGFIPEGLGLDALEISALTAQEEAVRRFKGYRHLPWLRGSDAHDIGQLGASVTRCLLHEPSAAELFRAVRGEEGRTVAVALNDPSTHNH